MHKGYTINFFRTTISQMTEQQIKKNFYENLSPRGGYDSEKSATFDEFIGDSFGLVTRELIEGRTKRAKTFGKTAKTRLLTALRLRKKTGKVLRANHNTI